MTSSADDLLGPTTLRAASATPPVSSAPSSTVWDSFWLRYGLALVFTGLATAFGFVLEDMTGRFSTFPFYAAIVASVWFGTGPGCAAVILSVLAVEDIWTPPLFNLAIADTELPSFAAFVLCTLMTFAWSSQRRNAQRVLEATVRERTADLQKTNDALQVEIRERLAAEEELRRSEALLAQGQKLSRTGSWILRMPAGEMRWSVELYELLGVDPEHDTPSYALLTDRIHREDRPRFTDAIEQALQTGGEFSCDMRLLIPGAEVKFVQVIGETTRRAAAGPSCIGTFIDLTERKRTEEALHKAEAELARTLRLATLAEVAATIAHEINQPLAAITANGSACLRSLTREPPLLDTAREAASCIVSDGHRAGNVIARVRALFEKDEPRRELVDINAIINEVIELSRSAIEREHVIVQTELTPTPVLSADPVQIQQVMVNLVTNALEAMEDVAARPHRLTLRSISDADSVTIEVEDTGIGLAADQLEHVFDSFYTTKKKGIGVGLAISRSIIEGHGGSAWVRPNKPHGACFGFSLPRLNDRDYGEDGHASKE